MASIRLNGRLHKIMTSLSGAEYFVPVDDAPRDLGIKRGGIRDRTMREISDRGRQYEDERSTSRSRDYWTWHRKAVEAAKLEAEARKLTGMK